MRRQPNIRFWSLTLLLSLLLSAPVTADDAIYFTAVNDMVLELNDATMPFWSGGLLYIPCSVFSGTGTGVNYSNNTAQRVIVLYDRRSNLVIDMNAGTIVDGSGNLFSQRPVQRGGVAFIPLVTIVSFFDITYSSSTVSITTDGRTTRGNVIRIKSAGAQLSDASFTSAAAATLASRYSDYIAKKNPPAAAEPVPDTPAPVTPTVPSTPPVSRPPAVTPPDDEPTVPDDDPEVKPAVKLYLCFPVEDVSTATAVLTLLESHGQRATFCFPAELLSESGDLLRRLVSGGHSVAFLAKGLDDAALSDANERLFRETGTKTRLLLDADRAGEGWKALEAAVASDTIRSTDAALRLLKRAEDAGNNTIVRLRGSETAIESFLAEAAAHEDTCLALTESAS